MLSVSDLPGWQHKIYLNKAILPQLREALRRCIDLRDGYVIKMLGCFAPRAKRVNGDLSTHSWGIAFDINADTNPLVPKGGRIVRDLPDAWIAIFEAIGWTWGGRFPRADAMHMQWAANY